jgi:hypothetical protein
MSINKQKRKETNFNYESENIREKLTEKFEKLDLGK